MDFIQWQSSMHWGNAMTRDLVANITTDTPDKNIKLSRPAPGLACNMRIPGTVQFSFAISYYNDVIPYNNGFCALNNNDILLLCSSGPDITYGSVSSGAKIVTIIEEKGIFTTQQVFGIDNDNNIWSQILNGQSVNIAYFPTSVSDMSGSGTPLRAAPTQAYSLFSVGGSSNILLLRMANGVFESNFTISTVGVQHMRTLTMKDSFVTIWLDDSYALQGHFFYVNGTHKQSQIYDMYNLCWAGDQDLGCSRYAYGVLSNYSVVFSWINNQAIYRQAFNQVGKVLYNHISILGFFAGTPVIGTFYDDSFLIGHIQIQPQQVTIRLFDRYNTEIASTNIKLQSGQVRLLGIKTYQDKSFSIIWSDYSSSNTWIKTFNSLITPSAAISFSNTVALTSTESTTQSITEIKTKTISEELTYSGTLSLSYVLSKTETLSQSQSEEMSRSKTSSNTDFITTTQTISQSKSEVQTESVTQHCNHEEVVFLNSVKISTNAYDMKLAYFTNGSYIALWSINTEDTIKLVAQSFTNNSKPINTQTVVAAHPYISFFNVATFDNGSFVGAYSFFTSSVSLYKTAIQYYDQNFKAFAPFYLTVSRDHNGEFALQTLGSAFVIAYVQELNYIMIQKYSFGRNTSIYDVNRTVCTFSSMTLLLDAVPPYSTFLLVHSHYYSGSSTVVIRYDSTTGKHLDTIPGPMSDIAVVKDDFISKNRFVLAWQEASDKCEDSTPSFMQTYNRYGPIDQDVEVSSDININAQTLKDLVINSIDRTVLFSNKNTLTIRWFHNDGFVAAQTRFIQAPRDIKGNLIPQGNKNHLMVSYVSGTTAFIDQYELDAVCTQTATQFSTSTSNTLSLSKRITEPPINFFGNATKLNGNNTNATNPLIYYFPDGALVSLWQEFTPSNVTLILQAFRANGNKIGNTTQIFQAPCFGKARLEVFQDGRFVVAFSTLNTAKSDYQISAQYFSSSYKRIGSPIFLMSSSGHNLGNFDIAAVQNEVLLFSIIVATMNDSYLVTKNFQYYNGTLTLKYSTQHTVCNSPIIAIQVAQSSNNNRVVVAWSMLDNQGIFLQSYNVTSGVPNLGKVINVKSNPTQIQVDFFSNGNYLLAWQESQNCYQNNDLKSFVQIYANDTYSIISNKEISGLNNGDTVMQLQTVKPIDKNDYLAVFTTYNYASKVSTTLTTKIFATNNGALIKTGASVFDGLIANVDAIATTYVNKSSKILLSTVFSVVSGKGCEFFYGSYTNPPDDIVLNNDCNESVIASTTVLCISNCQSLSAIGDSYDNEV